MASRTSRTVARPVSSVRDASAPSIKPASSNHRRAEGPSPSRSTPVSASQVFTNDWTTSNGMGAGLVSASGTQVGRAMKPS